MSNKEKYIVQTNRSKPSNDKDPEYNSDGNLVEKDDKLNMFFSEEEEGGSDESNDQSDYTHLCSEKMAQNHSCLLELVLVTKEGGSTITRELGYETKCNIHNSNSCFFFCGLKQK